MKFRSDAKRTSFGGRHNKFVSNFMKVYFGLVFGATLGLFIYVLVSLFFHPYTNFFSSPSSVTTEGLYSATREIILAFGFYEILSVLGGGLIGIGIMLGPRKFALFVTTITLGALSGLAVYVLGFVSLNYATIPTDGYYAYAIQAIYSFTAAEFICIVMGMIVGFLIAKNLWRFTGVLTYVSLISIIFGFLLYSFTVTLPLVPAGGKLVSIILIAAESISLLMVAVYAFYALDVYVKTGWRRTPSKVPFSKYYIPRVAFHVPCYNEPPQLVIDTVQSLLNVDYPKDRYEIMVIDDSTDESSWKPIKSFCDKHGVTYLRRTERKGYKAGALNYAIKKTSDDTDLIAIIDADYQIIPEYLKEVVGYFINSNLAFIQTPQDYRNKYQNYLTEQYYYADSYFYRAVLPSRNEANAIIFAGTMGIIRKDVLENVGGWGETFICEDAEISVRILHHGYDSLYINKTYGRGLIPHTYEGYKKQLYRWSFGGVKILKAHFFKFIFSKKMTIRQKFDFLIGGMHWFDGIWITTIASVLVYLALGDIFGFPTLTYHQREVWLVGLVPMFLLADGIIRLHMALKHAMGLSIIGTFRVMGMWFAIKFNNMFAALKSLVGINIPFVRTPKRPTENIKMFEAIDRSIKLSRFETAGFILLLSLAVMSIVKTFAIYFIAGDINFTRFLLAFWLLFYSMIFVSAPMYAYKSYRSSATRKSEKDVDNILKKAKHTIGQTGASNSLFGGV